MTTPYLRRDVTEAAAALREAQITLVVCIEQAYPKGTEVIVKIGRTKVRVRITGYGSNISAPGDLVGTNVATGKRRQFHHSQIQEAVEVE